MNSHKRIVFRYVDPDGDAVPAANPNGSAENIAGIVNESGNVIGMMPHPERVFRTVKNSWHPDTWGEDSPWMRLFRNARVWVD